MIKSALKQTILIITLKEATPLELESPAQAETLTP